MSLNNNVSKYETLGILLYRLIMSYNEVSHFSITYFFHSDWFRKKSGLLEIEIVVHFLDNRCQLLVVPEVKSPHGPTSNVAVLHNCNNVYL